MAALIALCIAVAVSTLVYALAGRDTRAQAVLDTRLNRASGKEPAGSTQADLGPALRGSRMSKSVALSHTLEQVRTLQNIGALLERSGWRLSVVEFLAISAT